MVGEGNQQQRQQDQSGHYATPLYNEYLGNECQ